MNDDLISRQAAIDTLNVDAELLRRVLDNTDLVGAEREKFEWGLGLIESHIYDMEELPSAQPERLKGRWIESHEHAYIDNGVKEWINWYCSECDAPNSDPTDFCPNCGADMRGES